MTENEFYGELGETFKKLREAKGWTLSQEARKISVPSALIGQFETNGKKISAYRLNQLLKLFGLSSIVDIAIPQTKKFSRRSDSQRASAAVSESR